MTRTIPYQFGNQLDGFLMPSNQLLDDTHRLVLGIPSCICSKKDGSTRFSVDYHKLNRVTCKDEYPLPRIDYNASQQSTTGYSPFYLMFGRRPQLPIDVMYSTPDQPRDAVPQYVNKLHQTLRE